MEKLTSIYQVAFEGEFARLREFGPNDAEALVACSQDQAVARFMRWAQTLDEAHMLVEKSSEDVQQIPWTRYHLAGVDLESGEVISIIRLSVTSRENGRVRISLGVRPDLRDQGWAPAIWPDVAAFVFEQLRAHRLYALIHEENARRSASRRRWTSPSRESTASISSRTACGRTCCSIRRCEEWEAMRANRLGTEDGRA